MLNTYLQIYLLVYCITLFSFFTCLHRRLCIVLINSLPLNVLIEIFELFESTLRVVLILLLFLSGLPPFLLFFIKFNLIISVITTINTYLIVFVYVVIFNSTLYYLQVFSNKSKTYKVMLLLNSKLSFKSGFIFFNNCKNRFSVSDYYMLLRIAYLSFISLFGYSFFLDFYFISLLFI